MFAIYAVRVPAEPLTRLNRRSVFSYRRYLIRSEPTLPRMALIPSDIDRPHLPRSARRAIVLLLADSRNYPLETATHTFDLRHSTYRNRIRIVSVRSEGRRSASQISSIASSLNGSNGSVHIGNACQSLGIIPPPSYAQTHRGCKTCGHLARDTKASTDYGPDPLPACSHP